jgi:hypothetical protein
VKTGLTITLLVVAIPVALIACYRWDSERNRGYGFGYWGAYNRVSNALASISDFSITQAWANCDVTLEEFYFVGTNREGRTIRIAVGERDRIRELSGEPLILALQKEIEILSSSTNNTK